MRFGHTYPPFSYKRFSNVHKALNSSDTLIPILHYAYDVVASADANDGDKYIAEFYLEGNETTLSIGYNKNTSRGQFDIYVNGVKDDQATVDTYNGSAADSGLTVVLCAATLATIQPGRNTVELRVNGKNVASTDYAIACYGMSFY